MSHVNMGTNFSGTDMSELSDNVDKHLQYLSVIVNNKGEYNGHVAKEAMIDQNIKIKSGVNKYVEINSSSKKMLLYDVVFVIESINIPLQESFLKNVNEIIEKSKNKFTNTFISGKKYSEVSELFTKKTYVEAGETTSEGFLAYHLLNLIDEEHIVSADAHLCIKEPIKLLARDFTDSKFLAHLRDIKKDFEIDYEVYYGVDDVPEEDFIIEVNILKDILNDYKKANMFSGKEKSFANYIMQHLNTIEKELNESVSK